MTEPETVVAIRPRGGNRGTHAADYAAAIKAEADARKAAADAAYVVGPRERDEDGMTTVPFRPIHRDTATASEAGKWNPVLAESATGYRRPQLDHAAEECSLRDVLPVARAIKLLTDNLIGSTFTAAELGDYADIVGYRGSLANPLTRLALEGYASYAKDKGQKHVTWTLVHPIDLDELRASRA